MSKKKSNSAYLNLAEKMAPFSEKIRRIKRNAKRRKNQNLKPWEKAFISRLTNIAQKAGRGNLYPVNKAQAKALKGTGLVVGKGIQGVKIANSGKNTKIKIKNGKISIISNKREWVYVPIDFQDAAQSIGGDDFVRDILYDEMEKVISENPGADISFALMTSNGRVDQTKKFGGEFGEFGVERAFNYMNGFINKYQSQLGEMAFKINGFVYFIHD